MSGDRSNPAGVPSVDVVICAYTDARWGRLSASIESMRQQTIGPAAVILSIDHNPDLFQRVRAAFPDVVVVENQEARGLSGARNAGIAAGRSEVIAFLDDDATAAPDWVARLAAGYADESVLGVGGEIIPVWSDGSRPPWFPAEFDWVVGCSYRGLPERVRPVRNLIGCNMSFRRRIFAEVGGFRSGIGRVGTRPVGCEETELCIRASRRWPAGVILYEPRARVHHHIAAARERWSYYRARCYAEGISKALVSRLVGPSAGLASERRHLSRTLPMAALRALSDLATHRDPWGLARAGAIVAGVTFATAGYVRASFTAAPNVTT